MNCPTCQELRRQGIDDPILAIKRMMLIHQFYVKRLGGAPEKAVWKEVREGAAMRREKPHAMRCVCKRYPLVAPGRKIRCVNKRCIFWGRRFATVDEYNEAQQVAVVTAIEICREFGLLKEAI